MEAEAKQEVHEEGESKQGGHEDGEAPTADETRLAPICVASFGGEVIADLKEDVAEQVRKFKQKVVSASGRPRMTEIILLLNGQVLPHAGTLADAGLKSGESYALTGLWSQHWILDEGKKGDGVVLLEENVVRNTVQNACPYYPTSCRMILGKSALPAGRHHFRVRLVSGSHYYIGVAEEDVNLNTWLGSQKGRGWSYYLRDDGSGSRLGPGYKDCGSRLYEGDSVSFCFDTVEGTLEFARNDDELQLAASELAGKDLYLALGMGANDTTLKLEEAWRER